jgi:coenzyme PQQ precursor peptide PqqA
MREWHKPTVEETESSMEVTNYLPAERIALNPSLLILRTRNGGPAGAGSPFPFGGLRATLSLRQAFAKTSRSDFLNVVSRQISSTRHVPLIETGDARIGLECDHERRGSRSYL